MVVDVDLPVLEAAGEVLVAVLVNDGSWTWTSSVGVDEAEDDLVGFSEALARKGLAVDVRRGTCLAVDVGVDELVEGDGGRCIC